MRSGYGMKSKIIEAPRSKLRGMRSLLRFNNCDIGKLYKNFKTSGEIAFKGVIRFSVD
jgi:hypothetical protein